MAVLGTQSLTLKDLAKRLGPDHTIARIVELLNETNEINDDSMYLEANNITTHRTTIRSGLPESYWRVLNRGVPRSKSHTIQVDDRIGMLETWSVVDAALADLNGQNREFMLSEERAFLEAMNQEVARTIFYGDLATNPETFLGLSPRFSVLDPAKAENAENVINYGGTGNNLTSIWLISWGDQTAHMIYPKGLPIGLKREYIGRVPVLDQYSNEFMGYKTNYSWKLGLVVRDWRYIVRICNIPMDELQDIIDNGAATAASQKLVRKMIEAHHKIPNIRLGRVAWYMNKIPQTMLHVMAAEKSNVNLSLDTFAGRRVVNFLGNPIRTVDALGAENQVA